jgi:muramidase (phage lysozyme)
MATLSDLVRQKRSSGVSRTGSLKQSLKEKIKETIDPRQFFFKQNGLMTALFPSLKAYKTDKVSDLNTLSKTSNQISMVNDVQLDRIIFNTKMFAKNTSYLKEIGRDVNVLRQNMKKFVELYDIDPATKADRFFIKSAKREKEFESKFKKDKTLNRVEKETKKGSFSWLKLLTTVGATAIGALVLDFFVRKEDSIVMGLYNKIKNMTHEFLESVKGYINKQYIQFENSVIKLKDEVFDTIGDTVSDVIGLFSLGNIKDYLITDKNPFEEFDSIVNAAKKKIGESFDSFSFFPEAQAATLSAAPRSVPATTKTQNGIFPSESMPIPQRDLPVGKEGLLEQIARGEGTTDAQAQQKGFASGYDVTLGYGIYHRPTRKPLSQMTVGEVKVLQSEMLNNPSNHFNSSAAGKYQIVRKTLVGLQQQLGFSDSQIFSPEFQDYLAMKLLEGRGLKRMEKVTEKYKSGLISPEMYQMEVNRFQNNLAMEWASIATTGSGRSYYNQHTGTKTSEVQAAIRGAFSSNALNVTSVNSNRTQAMADASAQMITSEMSPLVINRTHIIENNNLQIIENRKSVVFKSNQDPTTNLIELVSGK